MPVAGGGDVRWRRRGRGGRGGGGGGCQNLFTQPIAWMQGVEDGVSTEGKLSARVR